MGPLPGQPPFDQPAFDRGHCRALVVALMAYRATPKVKAALAAKREAILEAALASIADGGNPTSVTKDIVARSGIAMGTIYHHFIDVEELLTRAVGHALVADLAAMREAASRDRWPINALARAVAVFYRRQKRPRLARYLASNPHYVRGIRPEFQRLIAKVLAAPALGPADAKIMAAACIGAIYGVRAVAGNTDEGTTTAVAVVLRALGVPNAAVERLSNAVIEEE